MRGSRSYNFIIVQYEHMGSPLDLGLPSVRGRQTTCRIAARVADYQEMRSGKTDRAYGLGTVDQ